MQKIEMRQTSSSFYCWLIPAVTSGVEKPLLCFCILQQNFMSSHQLWGQEVVTVWCYTAFLSWFLDSQCATEKCVFKSKTSFGILQVPKPSWSVTEVVATLVISSVAFCGIGLMGLPLLQSCKQFYNYQFFCMKALSASDTQRVSTYTIEYKLIHTLCKNIIKINTN